MIPIIIENNDFQIPGSWDEVTVRQFRDMVDSGERLSPVRLLSVFTGIDYESLNNFDCAGFVDKVLPLLSFVREPLELSTLPRRPVIHLEGHEVPVIKDPGKERIGQKLRMQGLLGQMESTGAQITSIMAEVVANYYAPKLHAQGLWDEAHVDEVAQMALAMPITEAVPEVNFFLRGYMNGLRRSA